MMVYRANSQNRAQDRLFEPCQQLLKARIVAQDVVVRVVLDPVALSPASGEDSLEYLRGFFFLTCLGMQTGGVNQGTHVIGIEFERSLRPFHRTRALSIVESRTRTERERSSIQRI